MKYWTSTVSAAAVVSVAAAEAGSDVAASWPPDCTLQLLVVAFVGPSVRPAAAVSKAGTDCQRQADPGLLLHQMQQQWPPWHQETAFA